MVKEDTGIDNLNEKFNDIVKRLETLEELKEFKIVISVTSKHRGKVV